MAEMDAFERRVADTLLGYADEAAPALDAATVARRAALAHPRGAAAGLLPWRLVAIPRLAWVLLLAGLLVALIGGMLVVGSQPVRKLPAVLPPMGQVFQCPPGSNPDRPGPVNQARPPLWEEMAFDRRAGRLVVVTGAEGIVETWTFDVCTNTWTRMHPNREPPSLSFFGTLVYDVDSDVTVALDDANRMWAYDLDVNTWTEKGPFAPFVHSHLASLQFYDPVSGLVVALGDDGDDNTLGLALWGYEVETDTWTPIRLAEPLVIGPHYEIFAYDASLDRLVAYANNWGPPDEDQGRLYESMTGLFDLRTGTWSGTSAVTPGFFHSGIFTDAPAIAYDEAAQRTVMLGQGHSAAYDATADRWETLYEGSTAEDWWAACGTRPECRQMPHLVYDPVNERLVAYGGTVYGSEETGSVSPDDVQAFDTRTREWTVLLEASQPAPTSQ